MDTDAVDSVGAVPSVASARPARTASFVRLAGALRCT